MKRSVIGLSLVSVAVTLILNGGVAAADSGGSQPVNINPAKNPVTNITPSLMSPLSLTQPLTVAGHFIASFGGDTWSINCTPVDGQIAIVIEIEPVEGAKPLTLVEAQSSCDEAATRMPSR
jgi:hypothetical protein